MRRLLRIALPLLVLLLAATSSWTATAQQAAAGRMSAEDRAFIAYDQPIIFFANVQVVDGTGAPPRRNMSVLIENGRIARIAPADELRPPASAAIIDGSGRTLLPGFVMLHEHLILSALRADAPVPLAQSFSRLYLAGGVTTQRTAGSFSPYADIDVAHAIGAGRQPGPDLDVTSPLFGDDLHVGGIHLRGPEQVAPAVRYLASAGITSFKAYQNITRAELGALIRTAHGLHLRVAGHLCSVTFREAAELGIDSLEHGFFPMTDFVAGKQPDLCPSAAQQAAARAALDPDGPAVGDLVRLLIARHVTVTSTLSVFDMYATGWHLDGELALLAPGLRDVVARHLDETAATPTGRALAAALPKLMRMERRFVAMGGTLVSGTDTGGYFGGQLPGYSSLRQLELLVQAGFSFPEALRIQTLNGARFLGRAAEIGSIEVGKRADLLLIDGDPVADPRAVERLRLVFKAGVGYDRSRILAAMRGQVGLW